MRNSLIALAAGLLIGIGGTLFIAAPEKIPFLHSDGPDGHGHGAKDGHGHGGGAEVEENPLKLSDEQVTQSGISLAQVREGELVRTTTFPGNVVANPDQVAAVAAKSSGVIVDLKKRLGDTVAKGELLAVLESREIAEAKGEFLAAQRSEALARTTFERERNLWEKKISSEQDYLQARATVEEARIRIDLARQRLAAFGFNGSDLSRLNGSNSGLQVLEIRSPIAGRVVERRAVLGASVPSETELFTVADLSRLWIEASVAPTDLAAIREGDAVVVDGPNKAEGKVVFVSPVVDRETRLAKIIVQIGNTDSSWRLGDFASVTVKSAVERAAVLVPKAAIQRMKKESVVFVRTPEGFEMREVVLGRSDGNQTEIRFGVEAGEAVAVVNSFVLKAQVEKAEAEHSH
ncbi:efflux RND transporter periplasmic adaptor subunit [Ferrovibrio sp.]|uniref:efflux RND transporter periplasmic adaptor subunit n=1 Tax=Ferrovibrio sp. TaxID=1917215 RepID=UPI003D0E0633